MVRIMDNDYSQAKKIAQNEYEQAQEQKKLRAENALLKAIETAKEKITEAVNGSLTKAGEKLSELPYQTTLKYFEKRVENLQALEPGKVAKALENLVAYFEQEQERRTNELTQEEQAEELETLRKQAADHELKRHKTELIANLPLENDDKGNLVYRDGKEVVLVAFDSEVEAIRLQSKTGFDLDKKVAEIQGKINDYNDQKKSNKKRAARLKADKLLILEGLKSLNFTLPKQLKQPETKEALEQFKEALDGLVQETVANVNNL